MSVRRVSISWLAAEDTAFRAAYLAETGETLQADPLVSEDTLRHSVFSWRVSDAQIAALQVLFPDLEVA